MRNTIMLSGLVERCVSQERKTNLSFLIAPKGMGKTSLLSSCLSYYLEHVPEGLVKQLSGDYSPKELIKLLENCSTLNSRSKDLLILIDDLINMRPDDEQEFCKLVKQLTDKGCIIVIAAYPSQLHITDNFSSFSLLDTRHFLVEEAELELWAQHYRLDLSKLENEHLALQIPALIAALSLKKDGHIYSAESFKREQLELLRYLFFDELSSVVKLCFIMCVLKEGNFSQLEHFYKKDNLQELLSYLNNYHSYFNINIFTQTFEAFDLPMESLRELMSYLEIDAVSLVKQCLGLCVKAQKYERALLIYTMLGSEAKPQELLGLHPLAFVGTMPAALIKHYAKDCLHNYNFPSPEDLLACKYAAIQFNDLRLAAVCEDMCQRSFEQIPLELREYADLLRAYQSFLRQGDLLHEDLQCAAVKEFCTCCMKLLQSSDEESKAAFLSQIYKFNHVEQDKISRKLYTHIIALCCILSGLYHEGMALVVKEGSFEQALSIEDVYLALDFCLLNAFSYIPDAQAFELPSSFFYAETLVKKLGYQDLEAYLQAVKLICMQSYLSKTKLPDLEKALLVATRRSDNFILALLSLYAAQHEYLAGAQAKAQIRLNQSKEFFRSSGLVSLKDLSEHLLFIINIQPQKPQLMRLELKRLLKDCGDRELCASLIEDDLGLQNNMDLCQDNSKDSSTKRQEKTTALHILDLFIVAQVCAEKELSAILRKRFGLILASPMQRAELFRAAVLLPEGAKVLSEFLPLAVLNRAKAILSESSGDKQCINSKLPRVTIASPEQDQDCMQLALLGRFELSYEGKILADKEFHKRKNMQLLSYLALHQVREISRQKIVADLWPHLEYCLGRNNLYSTLSLLRKSFDKVLKGREWLICMSNSIRLNPDLIKSDIMQFENLVRILKTEQHSLSKLEMIDLCLQLDTLYKGDLVDLEGLDLDLFNAIRANLREEFVDSMLLGHSLSLSLDDENLSHYFIQRARKAEPYRDDVVKALMRFLHENSRRAEAVDLFFDYESYMAKEYDLEPSVEIQELFSLVNKGKVLSGS